MKKIAKIVVLSASLIMLLASCSKKNVNKTRKPSENIDSSVWIDNLIDGKAAAKKENKKIFLFFSGDDQDGASLEMKNDVFLTQDFLDKYTQKYVLVNLDFSNSLFEASKADPLATDEEKNAAGQIEERLQENMRDASLYDIQGTPAFYILTKEGYVITEVIFEDKVSSIEQVDSAFENLTETIAIYENTMESTKTGSDADRLNAIENLFEITDSQHRYLLVDFSALFIKLDKKNETGKVGKHVVAIANANAVQAYMNSDPLAASDQFANAAKSKYLKAEEKQQCYYTAGYLYAQSNATDFAKIKSYFEKAYEADPESPYAETIMGMVKMLEERIAESEYKAQESDTSNEDATLETETAESAEENVAAPTENSDAQQ